MNNGKVRIYDLSKELNLDNKELLAICDQLDIAVKSHSSTITEGEAERIRTAAEKQVTTMPASSKESSANNNKPNSQQVTNKAKPRPMVPPKPQIVQIKHNNKISDRSNPNSPDYPTAPSAPVRPVAATPPARTTEQNQSVVPPTPTETNLASDRTTEATTVTNNGSRTNETPVFSDRSNSSERPRLSVPPSRPAAPSAQTNSGNRPSRPILKREQPDSPTPQPPETAAAGRVEVPAGKVEKPARRPASAQSADSGAPRPKSLLELHRPKPARPNEPVTAISPERPKDDRQQPDLEEELDTGAEISDTKPILKRPSLPRPINSKGGKKWQEEEIDEGQDSGAKGKLGAKAKRLKPMVDIEDEDLDDDELNK
jgi:translation initiation factor IF-2